MVRVRFAVAVCTVDPESVTLKVNGVAVTGKVGVPPISPLDAVRVKPAGSVPAVNCQGTGPVPPLSTSVRECATPTGAYRREVVEMVSVGGARVRLRVAPATLTISTTSLPNG